jgi:hypothetical protein
MGYDFCFITRQLSRWSASVILLLLVLVGNHIVLYSSAIETPTTSNATEGPSSSPPSSSLSLAPTTNVCGVYLAKSTIPGAGLGMFAGQYDYQKGDLLGDSDLIIPAYDLKWNNYYSDEYTFLWEEYTWKASSFMGMKEEIDKVKKVKACSPGEINPPVTVVCVVMLGGFYSDRCYGCQSIVRNLLVPFRSTITSISVLSLPFNSSWFFSLIGIPGYGAAVNCVLTLVNAKDDYSSRTMGTSGVDSATSPGAGGFTPYYGRTWVSFVFDDTKSDFSLLWEFALETHRANILMHLHLPSHHSKIREITMEL